jgi:hypothetical protein
MDDSTLTELISKMLVFKKNFVIKIPITKKFNELPIKFSMFQALLKYINPYYLNFKASI